MCGFERRRVPGGVPPSEKGCGMNEIWFHNLLETTKVENLSFLLNGKFGYTDCNPGPVVAYPPNLPLFPVGIPEVLPAGTRIAIPWTQARLQKQIKLDQAMIRERKEAAQRAVKALNQSYDEANRMAMTVDVIAVVALMMFSAGTMAADVRKVLSVGETATKEATEEAAKIVMNMKRVAALGSYPGINIMAGLNPTAFVGKGHWWQNLARHALSVTSPSYWASLVASAWTGDWDLWKYGAGGVRDQGVARILRDFAKEAGAIGLRIVAMERQLRMSFYGYRATASEAVYAIPPYFGSI